VTYNIPARPPVPFPISSLFFIQKQYKYLPLRTKEMSTYSFFINKESGVLAVALVGTLLRI
jgi:hypothetical protein